MSSSSKPTATTQLLDSRYASLSLKADHEFHVHVQTIWTDIDVVKDHHDLTYPGYKSHVVSMVVILMALLLLLVSSYVHD